MSMSDPLADMLTRIRNAITARKKNVVIPYSKIKERIAEILHEEGFLSGVSLSGETTRGGLSLGLAYTARNQSIIQALHRVSRPGQRRYVDHGSIPEVRSGLGVAILSTSRGVMTDKQARELGIGGELLCEVW